MFPTLLDNQAIVSTAWMIILTILPPDFIRIGALLLGGAICVWKIMHALRPRMIMEILQIRHQSLEETLQEAVESGIMDQADSTFSAGIERDMGRRVALIRYRVLDLHERTLLASAGILQEMKAAWCGDSFEIVQCIREVNRLKMDLEVKPAMVLKKRYHLWR